MQSGTELIEHMHGARAARQDLRDLGVVWQMIEASAAISCPEESETVLPTLVRTRERFDDLQVRLIAAMSEESRAALEDQLSAKAQCAIDILVRNLFERTADVGFLATDDEIRRYCALAPDERLAAKPAMVRRLAEYQAKYSVYDEVFLLSPRGEILARLSEMQEASTSADPIVSEAIASTGYVERFRRSDLSADAAPALLYAHAIRSREGGLLGVLVLRFRFSDEMHHVFTHIGTEQGEVALLLIDEHRRVIVSSDETHVPIGSSLRDFPSSHIELTMFTGQQYLAVSCASSGYQGYAGPLWKAVAMVSPMTAFRQRAEHGPGQGSDVPMDNERLHEIVDGTDDINVDLRRVVWNGQLQASQRADDARRLKAVLQQVDRAGRRTRERGDRAIDELYRTALLRLSRQAGELARLAADILDRNLYERANDCRWWALSPALRTLLAGPADAASAPGINAILDYINGLYTVYSRLVVFDAEGVIRGASNVDSAGDLVGQRVPDAWLESLRRLRGSQAYAVSDFEDTSLHAHGPTYVYLAALRDPGDETLLRGGIAIVFHTQRELQAMLHDVLGERQGVAAFVDAQHRVLVATDRPLAEALVATAQSGHALVEVDGVHYACSQVAARGYREFKTRDGYQNGVRSLVALRLGSSERRQISFQDIALRSTSGAAPGQTLSLGVFQVGTMRCALPISDLAEMRALDALVRVPAGLEPAIGVAEASGGHLVPVLDARPVLGVHESSRRRSDGVLLFLHGRGGSAAVCAILADDVLAVLEVEHSSVHPGPEGLRRFTPWLVGVVETSTAEGEAVLIQLLDAERIRAELSSVVVGAEIAAASPLTA